MPGATHLGAGYHGQALFFGQTGSFHEVLYPNGVHGDRFLHENVLARFNGRFEMDGAKNGRSGQDDEVHVAGDDLLVGIESVEHGVLANLVNFVEGQFSSGEVGFYGGLGRIEVVLEKISHGDQFDVGIGRCAVGDPGPAATAPHADYTDADFVRSPFTVNGWDVGQ